MDNKTRNAPTLPHTLFVETGEGDLCANQTGRPTMIVRDLSVREKEAIAARYNSHDALVDALRELSDAAAVVAREPLAENIDHARALLSQLEAGK